MLIFGPFDFRGGYTRSGVDYMRYGNEYAFARLIERYNEVCKAYNDGHGDAARGDLYVRWIEGNSLRDGMLGDNGVVYPRDFRARALGVLRELFESRGISATETPELMEALRREGLDPYSDDAENLMRSTVDGIWGEFRSELGLSVDSETGRVVSSRVTRGADGFEVTSDGSGNQVVAATTPGAMLPISPYDPSYRDRKFFGEAHCQMAYVGVGSLQRDISGDMLRRGFYNPTMYVRVGEERELQPLESRAMEVEDLSGVARLRPYLTRTDYESAVRSMSIDISGDDDRVSWKSIYDAFFSGEDFDTSAFDHVIGYDSGVNGGRQLSVGSKWYRLLSASRRSMDHSIEMLQTLQDRGYGYELSRNSYVGELEIVVEGSRLRVRIGESPDHLEYIGRTYDPVTTAESYPTLAVDRNASVAGFRQSLSPDEMDDRAIYDSRYGLLNMEASGIYSAHILSCLGVPVEAKINEADAEERTRYGDGVLVGAYNPSVRSVKGANTRSVTYYKRATSGSAPVSYYEALGTVYRHGDEMLTDQSEARPGPFVNPLSLERGEADVATPVVVVQKNDISASNPVIRFESMHIDSNGRSVDEYSDDAAFAYLGRNVIRARSAFVDGMNLDEVVDAAAREVGAADIRNLRSAVSNVPDDVLSGAVVSPEREVSDLRSAYYDVAARWLSVARRRLDLRMRGLDGPEAVELYNSGLPENLQVRWPEYGHVLIDSSEFVDVKSFSRAAAYVGSDVEDVTRFDDGIDWSRWDTDMDPVEWLMTESGIVDRIRDELRGHMFEIVDGYIGRASKVLEDGREMELSVDAEGRVVDSLTGRRRFVDGRTGISYDVVPEDGTDFVEVSPGVEMPRRAVAVSYDDGSERGLELLSDGESYTFAGSDVDSNGDQVQHVLVPQGVNDTYSASFDDIRLNPVGVCRYSGGLGYSGTISNMVSAVRAIQGYGDEGHSANVELLGMDTSAGKHFVDRLIRFDPSSAETMADLASYAVIDDPEGGDEPLVDPDAQFKLAMLGVIRDSIESNGCVVEPVRDESGNVVRDESGNVVPDIRIDRHGVVEYKARRRRSGLSTKNDTRDEFGGSNDAVDNTTFTGHIGQIFGYSDEGLVVTDFAGSDNVAFAMGMGLYTVSHEMHPGSFEERLRVLNYEAVMSKAIQARIHRDIVACYRDGTTFLDTGDMTSLNGVYRDAPVSVAHDMFDDELVERWLDKFHPIEDDMSDEERSETEDLRDFLRRNYSARLEAYLDAKFPLPEDGDPVLTAMVEERREIESNRHSLVIQQQCRQCRFIGLDYRDGASIRARRAFEERGSMAELMDNRSFDAISDTDGRDLSCYDDGERELFCTMAIGKSKNQTTSRSLKVGTEVVPLEDGTFGLRAPEPREVPLTADGEVDVEEVTRQALEEVYRNRAIIMQMPILKNAEYNSEFRVAMAVGNVCDADSITEPVGVAFANLGGFCQDDSAVVDQRFCESHLVPDKINGGFRPLEVGDKISDGNGNKCVIGHIVDRSKPLPDDASTLDRKVREFFDGNSDLQVVFSHASFTSRMNVGGIRDIMENADRDFYSFDEAGKPIYECDDEGNPVLDADGNKVPVTHKGTQDLVLTERNPDGSAKVVPGGLGHLSLIIHDKYVESKSKPVADGHSGWQQLVVDKALKLEKRPLKSWGANDAGVEKARQLLRVGFGKDFYEDAVGSSELIMDDVSDSNVFDTSREFRLRNADGKAVERVSEWLRSDGGYMDVPFPVSWPARTETCKVLPPGVDSDNFDIETVMDAKGERVLRYNVTYGGETAPSYVNSDGERMWRVPVMPLSCRQGTEDKEGNTQKSEFSRFYVNIARSAAKYMKSKIARDRSQAVVDDFSKRMAAGERLSPKEKTSLKRAQRSLEKYTGKRGDPMFDAAEAGRRRFAGLANSVVENSWTDKKANVINRNVIRCLLSDPNSRAVWAGNPNLRFDEIEVGPEIAEALGAKDGSVISVYRDPTLTGNCISAFKVKVNEDIYGALIHPVVAARLAGDFDGDVVVLEGVRGEEALREVREKMSPERLIIDFVKDNGGLCGTGSDIAVGMYLDPSLKEEWGRMNADAQRIRNFFFDGEGANDPRFVDAVHGRPIDDNGTRLVEYDLFERVQDVVKRACERGCGAMALSMKDMPSFVESLDRVCVKTGSKGSMGALAEVASYGGVGLPDGRRLDRVDAKLWQTADGYFDKSKVVDFNRTLHDYNDDYNVQMATAVKTYDTALSGEVMKTGLLGAPELACLFEHLTAAYYQMALDSKKDGRQANTRSDVLNMNETSFHGHIVDLETGRIAYEGRGADRHPVEATPEAWVRNQLDLLELGQYSVVGKDYINKFAQACAAISLEENGERVLFDLHERAARISAPMVYMGLTGKPLAMVAAANSGLNMFGEEGNIGNMLMPNKMREALKESQVKVDVNAFEIAKDMVLEGNVVSPNIGSVPGDEGKRIQDMRQAGAASFASVTGHDEVYDFEGDREIVTNVRGHVIGTDIGDDKGAPAEMHVKAGVGDGGRGSSEDEFH